MAASADGGICCQTNDLHESDDPAARRRRSPETAAGRAPGIASGDLDPPCAGQCRALGMLALEASALRLVNMPIGSGWGSRRREETKRKRVRDADNGF